MSFGQTLIELRESRGIGRKRLYELSGLSLSYLHYIENDRVLPGPENLAKIAKALNRVSKHSKDKVSVEDLIRERDGVELERMGLDKNQADLTLLLRERGPLNDDAKTKIAQTIERVLKDPRAKARNRKQR